MRFTMSVGERAREPENAVAPWPVASARAGGGRIVGLRVRGSASVADIESLHASVSLAVERVGSGALICGDYRRAAPVSRPVASVWARAMRKSNPAIAGSALLLDPANAMFNLQVERIVQCAGGPTRRLFSDKGALCSWLDPDLTRSEREAVEAFLCEGDA